MTGEASADSSAAPPDVSVIIPVRDGGQALERCLEAVWAQDPGHWRFEVVVVDNGSPEDTRRRVGRFPGTTLHFERRPSSYAARNLGIDCSRGRFLAFIDADTEPQPGWLRAGADALAANGGPWLAAGAVEIILPEDPSLHALYDKMHNLTQERYVREGGFGVTANLFVPRGLAEQAGRFQEDWVSGADVDFSRQAQRAGGRIIYLPDAAVHHPARSTLAEFRSKKIRTGRGETCLARARSAWGRFGRGLPAVLLSSPLLLWPGVHAFRPRFQAGLDLGPRRALAIQLLYWLGKWYRFRGRLAEACARP